MADFNDSVALGVKPPDPQSGLNTLSSILGLGQQGLAIRGQQAQNQSLQAKATIDTQTAKENQNLVELIRDPIANGLVDNDGNPTAKAQQIIMQAAPTTGAQHYEGLLNGAKAKVEFNRSVNNLSSDERNEVNGVISGVAADPNATKDDAKAQLDAYVESKKGTPVYNDVKRIAGTSQQIMDHTQATQDQAGQIIPPGKEAWRNAGLTLGRTVIGAPAVVGAGGIATPQQANTGAGVVNRNPVTGALSAPPGAAPGSPINPTPVQVAGATTTATGQAAGDNERNTLISNSVAPSRQAIVLTQQMDKYADMVRTGKYSQEIANAQAALGVNSPEAAARQLMGKTAAQLKTIAIANAPSDTARDTINAGFPDPDKMNPDAIKGADEMIRGNMKMNLARAVNAQRFQETHKGTQGLRLADDQLTGNADGLMYEYQDLKPGPERQAFLQRHFKSRDEANAWIARKNLVEHNGGFGQ